VTRVRRHQQGVPVARIKYQMVHRSPEKEGTLHRPGLVGLVLEKESALARRYQQGSANRIKPVSLHSASPVVIESGIITITIIII
jgi:hypothetical protein